jgi:hypothetical protein
MLGAAPAASGFTSVCIDTRAGRSMQAVDASADAMLRRLADGLRVEGDRDVLATLVLAGLVEVRHPERGWLTGAAATNVVAADLPPDHAAGPSSRLARAAFEHARLLQIDDPATLAARLYFFNRLPITRPWREHWRNQATILAQLGLGRPDCFPTLTRIGGLAPSWIAWGRAGTRPTTRPFKLYLSPLPGDLGTCLRAVRRLPELDFYAVKIGGDVGTLLRPDKCVMYFANRASMEATASILTDRLRAIDGHGVPFTAWFDTKGLLSWGLDPAPEASNIGRFTDSSWRIWICNRLAVACLSSRALPVDDAWAFARASLHFSGVNCDSWAPLGCDP